MEKNILGTLLLLFINGATVFGMDQLCVPGPWHMLSKDAKMCIIARSALEDKRNLVLVNKELSSLASKKNIREMLYYVPCVVSRKDHLFWMIDCGRKNDEAAKVLMKRLLANAVFCNHADALDILSFFVPQKECPELLQAMKNHNDTKAFSARDIASLFPRFVKIYQKFPSSDMLDMMLHFIMHVYGNNTKIIANYVAQSPIHPYYKDQMTPLHVAMEHGHQLIAELLVAQDPKLLGALGVDNATPLHMAARGNFFTLCKFFLSFNIADVTVPDASGLTPLACASLHGHEDIVKLLMHYNDQHVIKQKNNICVTRMPWPCARVGFLMSHDKKYKKITDMFLAPFCQIPLLVEPLHTAVFDGNLKLVKKIIKKGCVDINVKDMYGINALFIAVKCRKDVIVHCLVKHGALINEKTNAGFTALMMAAQTGNKGDLVFLVKHGADVNYRTEYGISALDIAWYYENHRAVNFLIAKYNTTF